MQDHLSEALKSAWNVDSFRPCQREAIETALEGRDSLILLPTGGGKSLCYALFSIVAGKTVLVISPLISLMIDQVRSLREKGISATFLGSAQGNSSDVSGAFQGRMQVVFLTPEKAVAMTTCPVPNVGLIAVDEAHCTSEWGSDFRPEYGELGCIRKVVGGCVPVMALTASATPDVQKHIVDVLELRNPRVLRTSFDRANLRFSALLRPRSGNFANVLSEELSRDGGARLPAIVYVPNVKDMPGKPGVETIAHALRKLGHRVEHYHGQMTADERATRQDAFVGEGSADVMVATLAFGMGIDKANVRLVIHWGACKSIEGYFQQAGRAGRDGIASDCVLFHGPSDWPMLFRMAKGETAAKRAVEAATRRVVEMRGYCETTSCRRLHLVRHFGEAPAWSECGICDNCTQAPPSDDADLVDYTGPAEAILLAVAENERQTLSVTRLTALLLGDVSHAWMRELQGFESLKGVPPYLVRGIIERMVTKNLLTRVAVTIPGYNPFQSFGVGDAARSREHGAPVLLPLVQGPKSKRAPLSVDKKKVSARRRQT